MSDAEMLGRIHGLVSLIEKEHPSLSSEEKGKLLIKILGEQYDFEALNFYWRIVLKTAQEHNNKEGVEAAKKAIKRISKLIAEYDQEKMENN